MKKFCAMLLCILTSYLCFGQNDYHFSIAPRFSFTYGELTEILYGYDNEIVSRLDWEQKPLLNLGLEADIFIKDFAINSVFDFSLPVGTSYMYDSDDFNADEIFDKRSKHPISKTTNLNTELTLSYKVQCSSAITVFPLINFQYIYTSFEADKGIILFGQQTTPSPGKKVYANKIDYFRHSFFIFSGLGIKIAAAKNFSFNMDFLISPWGFQYASDLHHGSGNNPLYPFSTYDYINSFLSKIKINLAGDFKLSQNASILLFANFTIGFPDKGDCYTDYSSDEIYLSSQKCGADLNFIKAGTSLKILF